MERSEGRGLVGYLACGAIAVGSVGPWGGFFGYGGIGNNGSLTLLAAVAAGFAVWRWATTGSRAAAIAVLVLAAFTVALAVNDLLGIRDMVETSDEWAWIDGIGWGLGLVLFSGAALMALSISMCRRSRVVSRRGLNWMQGALVAAIGVVFLVGLSSVASSDPSRSESDSVFLQGPGNPSGAPVTDEKVLALRPGTSAESAMARLGPPESAVIFEDESSFYYGETWRLVFAEEGLRHRTKYPPFEQRGPSVFSPAYDRRLRALDRRIRRLRPGVSIEAVRARFGPPEGVEVHGESLRRDVGLWYGEWRLDFDGEKLEGAYR